MSGNYATHAGELKHRGEYNAVVEAALKIAGQTVKSETCIHPNTQVLQSGGRPACPACSTNSSCRANSRITHYAW